MKKITIFDNNLINNLDILIGSNKKENWNLLDISYDTDIWFHLDNESSPYVILSSNLDNLKNISNLDKSTLIYCANLCKVNSKLINSVKKVDVIYTTINNLKKGKTVGSVIIQNLDKVNRIKI